MADMSDVLDVLTDIENYLVDLPTKIILRANQIFIVNGLSDVSENLGIVTAGEFRAGNRNEPGMFLRTAVVGSGFSGMRMRYPAMSYDLDGTATDWNLVGINDDILQFGVRASDGKLVAGGGAVILDEDGITAVGGTIAGWTINSDHLLSPNVPGIKIASTGSIETTNFVTGIGGVGWRITKDGDVEFNNAVIRGELRTTVFTYQEVQAVAGTMGVFPSAGVLIETTVNVPAVASSMNIKVKDPEYAHAPLFGVNDILRIKDAARDTWLKVTGVTDSTTYYTYACTVMSGTTGTTYTAGQAVVSYGVSGEGFLLMEAVGTEAPYFSVRTHAGTPYGAGNEEHVRLGNLNGTPGTSTNIYGAYIGDETQYLKYTGGVLTLAGNGSGITSIDGGNITTGYINSDRIAAGSISADKIKANSITSDQLDTSVFRLKALAPSSLTMLCRFDGQEPYNTDFTGNPTGHMGQVAAVSGGVIYRPGKFGKAVQVAQATTNLVINPVMRTLWTAVNSPSIRELSTDHVVFDSYSLHVAGASTGHGAWLNVGTLTSGVTYTLSGYVKVVTAGCRLQIIQSGGSYTVYKYIQPSEDGYYYATFTMPETYSCNVMVAGGEAYWDGIQLEQKAYPTPLCYGDMPNHSWAGTAHASISSRADARLVYDADKAIKANEGTFSTWIKLPFDAGITYSVSPMIFVWWDSWNVNSFYCYFDSLYGTIYTTSYANSSANTQIAANTSDWKKDEWHLFTLTWKEGEPLKAYIDGALASTASGNFTPPKITSNALNISGSGYPITAYLDELAIFSRALTADEVRAIYESDAPLSANTSAWEFRSSNNLIWMDSNGLFVNDQSGHNAFGVIAVDNYAWGGFTTSDLDAGDIVFGRNVVGSSAIKWDISSGKFGFYGNANGTPQVEIGTDGSLLAGSGTVKLDVNGIAAGSSNNILRIDPSNATYMLWLGHATASSAPFSVKKDGTVYSRGNNMSTAIVTRGSAQSIPNAVASGGQLIAYDTQVYVSPTSMHSTTTNNYRLTAPMKGIYEVKASGKFGIGVGSSSYRQLGVYRYNSGGTVLGDIAADYRAATVDASTYVGVTAMLQLDAGDYIVSRAYHQYGANLNYTPYYFSLTLIKALE